MTQELADKSRNELYNEAGSLNNKLDHNVDMVTIMGFMSKDECVDHVRTLRRRLWFRELALELTGK